MLRVVLDTNVIVAAIRSKRGASAELLRLLDAGAFSIAISAPAVFEYEEVIVRDLVPAFLSLNDADQLIRLICKVGEKYEPERTLRSPLPDADDDLILDLAVASGVKYIVTHNVRDFVGSSALNIEVIRPSEFLRLLKGTP